MDPVLIAGHVIVAAHSIVSRNLDPLDAGVLSLCAVAGGCLAGFNVIPDEVVLTGTARSLRPEVQLVLEARLRETVESVARGLGGSATLEYEPNVPATINSEPQTRLARDAAQDVVGEQHVVRQPLPSLGGEDFAYMLRERPGHTSTWARAIRIMCTGCIPRISISTMPPFPLVARCFPG
ncbi:M20/M25/M40 family metallo-hydrolase [Achromobacter insolitus]|uniref:M20/M25/M40 family metallo-hydrolase n=1 Tax=Achromobacter insolitus TaxID=217204 RepID=UPI003CC577D1